MHRGKVGQIALHHLGPELAQRFGTLILLPDQGANLVPLGKQQGGEVAAYGADIASCPRHQDRAILRRVHRHITYPSLWWLLGLS